MYFTDLVLSISYEKTSIEQIDTAIFLFSNLFRVVEVFSSLMQMYVVLGSAKHPRQKLGVLFI